MVKLFIFISLLLISSLSPYQTNVTAEETIYQPPRMTDSFIRDNVQPTRQSANLNTVSSFANVVIFIRFSDEPSYTAPYSLSEYDAIFNGVNQPSLKDYFLEVSYNKLTVDSYLLNQNNELYYYTDSHSRDYYRPCEEGTVCNGYYTEEESQAREHTLLKNAIDYVDATYSFDESIDFDANQDSLIDSITFMVSGEDDGWNELFWPHRWALSTYYDYSLGEFTEDAPTLNGLHAYDYTFELMGHTRDYRLRADVGVLAHETFHLLSATDLYHYNGYEYIDNVGDWGLMDHTSLIPSHMLGYMKEYYGGWINDVREITEPGNYTLYPLQDSDKNIYRIPTGYSNEYVYLEYRNNTGFYESNLYQDTGLLVYRVDKDYEGVGNREGYYLSDGSPTNEVFIFRPDIIDQIEPIEFPIDPANDDYDGDISLAALSNNNLYDSAGGESDIMMFYSDGTLMDIEIKNVIEYDGFITFNVFFSSPTIELVLDEELSLQTDIRLLNNPSMDYQFELKNLGAFQAYYTTDGSIPSNSSTPYIGPVSFDFLNNQIKVAIYDGSNYVQTIEETYTFVESIETEHNGYGDNQNITYVIQPSTTITNTNLTFSNDSNIEEDYDFVYITTNNLTTSYTGEELKNLSISNITNTLLIQFTSDSSLSDYYGFSAIFTYDNIVTFHMNGEETMTLALGESYTELSGYIDPLFEGIYTFTTSGSIDSSIVGEQYIYYTVYDEENNIVDIFTRTVMIVDEIAPTITLNGDQTLTLEVHSTYEELGAIVEDNYDTMLTYEITSDLDTTTIGTYELIYTVVDSSGNTSTISRTVIIEDTTPPALSLIGDETLTLEVRNEYIEPGITITDNYDEELTYETETTLDNTSLGTYDITYTVTDSSGNTSAISRTVIVEDTTSPTITLLGEETIYLEVHTPYQEAGIILTDNFDQNLDYTVESNIDHTVLGTYEVTYTTTDSSGNSTTVSRTIIVEDTISPILTILGDETLILEVHSVYIEEGISVNDNYNESLTYTVNSNIDTSILGSYEVTYKSTDSSGNTATITRTIQIVDTTAPTANLNPGVDTIYLDEEHLDQGITATDNYDDVLSINTTSTVDTSQEGSYLITYVILDSSNNETIITRVVTVLQKEEPVTFTFFTGRVAYYQNEQLTLPTCMANNQTCTLDSSSVDNEKAGMYLITYTVMIDDQPYQYQLSIIIYNKTTTLAIYQEKKRGIFL